VRAIIVSFIGNTRREGSTVVPLANRASLQSIQILRAVAALFVMFAHLWPMLLAFGITDAIPNFIFGASGVDLFFVISGFIMVYTSQPLFGQRDGSRKFLLRRVIRIVPMYWGLTIATLIGRNGLATQSDLTWANIVGSFLFIPTTRPAGDTTPVLSVGWTLNYEMLFYILFAGAMLLPRRQAVVALTVFMFALVGVPSILGGTFTTPWSVWTSSFLCEFVFGMWIGMAFVEGWRVPLVASAFMVAAALALMIYTSNTGFAPVSRVMGWGIGAALIVAGIVLADTAMTVPTVLRPLVVTGDSSYALYLVHTMVPPALLLLRVPHVVDPVHQPILYCAIVVAVSLCAAFLLNLIDQKARNMLLRRMHRSLLPKKAYDAGTAI
jgi:exopolysaccharide production protein ExoZ